MVRILWFKETSRWSRRGIPLRVVWVSPRQLSILVTSFLVGSAFSAPLHIPNLKLVAVGSALLVGLTLSFWKVKMLTPEQLIFLRLRSLQILFPRGSTFVRLVSMCTRRSLFRALSASFSWQKDPLITPYIYEVGLINYFNLSEPERNAVLARFSDALQQLSSAVVFRVRLDTMNVVVGNELYSVKYRRYFLESDQPLEIFLATMGLQEKYARVMEMPGYTVVSNLPKCAVLDNGDLAKAYSITSVSSDLDIAFLAMHRGEGSIIDMTDEVRIRMEPLRRDESKGLMRLHADTLEAKWNLIEMAGGRDRELSQEGRMAEEAAQAIISGSQKLFRVSCVLVARGTNLHDLRNKTGSFWDAATGVVTELDSPKGIQHFMVTGKGPNSFRGANLLMSTESVLSFFPFAGLEIIEHDGIWARTSRPRVP